MREAQGRGFAAHKTLVLDFGTGKGQDAMRLLTRSLLGIVPGGDERQRKEAADRAVEEGWVSPADRPSLDDLLDLPTKGEGRALYEAMDETTRQARRRTLLAGLAKRLTRDRPLFIAVEDVHWADATLLDDLAALAGVTAEAPVVLVLTTRPEGDPIDRRWRAKLGSAAIGTIDLSPLTPAEASQLAADLLGTGDERIAACVERAGGNPFFLEQLLRHTGEIAAAAVPASVQSLVLGRADRLPPAHKRALLPEVVEQPVGAHRRPGRERQVHEQLRRLAAGDRDRLAVSPDLDRAQHQELEHGASVGRVSEVSARPAIVAACTNCSGVS